MMLEVGIFSHFPQISELRISLSADIMNKRYNVSPRFSLQSDNHAFKFYTFQIQRKNVALQNHL